jgi:cytochrome c2
MTDTAADAPAEPEATETEMASADAVDAPAPMPDDETMAEADPAPAADEAATEDATTEVAAEEPAGTTTETDVTEMASAEAPAAEAPEAEASEAVASTEADAAAEPATEMAAASDGAWPEEQMAFLDGDPAAGERVWRQCSACHVAEREQNRVGPHLVDIIGREVASLDGFRYSDALRELQGQTWTPRELDAWIENPRGYARGTSMGYAGLREEEQRRNLFAYLYSLQQ